MKPKSIRTRRLLVAVTALAVASVILAGCTKTGTTNASGGGSAVDPNITIAFVTHGSAGDSFWDVVKSGAEQAGKDLGVNVTYQSDGDAAAQSQLIDAAVASKPQGLVVSLANPDGVAASVKAAVKAGIPVIATNKGGSNDEWKQYGMETYIGQSEFKAGQAVGTRMKDAGVAKAICVIHEVGNVGMEDRCRGVKDTLGGAVTNIQVDQSNLGDAQSTIRSALVADPSVNGVVSLNSPITVIANAAIEEAGSSAKLGAFEISPEVLSLIDGGKLLFTVDQQPYLQGYLPVVFLVQQVRNGTSVGGGQPVYTGPDFVTKDNSASIAKFAANGTR